MTANRARSAVGLLVGAILLGAGAAGALSVGLDRAAGAVAGAAAAARTGRFLSALAADPSLGSGGLRTVTSGLMATEPELRFARVEAAGGAVLVQVGREADATRWLDRTYWERDRAVRVRVGYRPPPPGLGSALRAAVWAASFALFAGVLLVLAWFGAVGRRGGEPPG